MEKQIDRKEVTLVEVSYRLISNLRLKRRRRRHSEAGDRDIRKILMVIESANLSQDTVTEHLKKDLQRSLKQSIEMVAYRAIESEYSNGSRNNEA